MEGHVSQFVQSPFRHTRQVPVRILFACVWLIALVSMGCVERRMTIRTNVDKQGGALAIIDNREIGTTPVSTALTYYADREIRLIKDGHETVTLIQPIPAPWWDSLLLEFFVENLWPFTIRDEREFHYDLPPVATVTTGELLDRAQNLRNEGHTHAEPAMPSRSSSVGSRVSF